jgi:hypothetical protein
LRETLGCPARSPAARPGARNEASAVFIDAQKSLRTGMGNTLTSVAVVSLALAIAVFMITL